MGMAPRVGETLVRQIYLCVTKPCLTSISLQAESSVYPLLFEPGEGWEYSYSIDWAGVVVSSE